MGGGPGEAAGGGARWSAPLRRFGIEITEGLRVVAADRRRFGPLLLGAVGAAYVIVPEAIAVAYVHALGHGPSGVGLVMASAAGGTVLGNLLRGRFGTATRAREHPGDAPLPGYPLQRGRSWSRPCPWPRSTASAGRYP